LTSVGASRHHRKRRFIRERRCHRERRYRERRCHGKRHHRERHHRERGSTCKATTDSHLGTSMRAQVLLHVIRPNRLVARDAVDISVLPHL
jgi:hypothetical protein